MIISRGRRFIFVHIPKTGGTSLALALEQRAMKDDILIGDTPKAQRRKRRFDGEPFKQLRKHATLSELDPILPTEQLDEMFVFTLVRNPWDRMVSYYHWLLAQSFDHPAVRLAQSVDFPSFVRAGETQAAQRTWPATRYVSDAGGVDRCDCYIRLESFQEDARPLWDHLGFRLSLPWVNRSSRQADYRRYYDDELVDIVAACCAADISRFGYSF